MQSKYILIVISVIAIILLFCTSVSYASDPITVSIRIEGQHSTIWNGTITFSNSIIVDSNGKTHNLDKPTPLGALAQASKYGNFQYEVKSTAIGLYLNSINRESAKGASGWIYLIDYSMPMISADKYELKDGDNILWSYGGLNSKPLSISVSSTSVFTGEQFTVNVNYLDRGRGIPLDGATVYVGNKEFTTNTNGVAHVTIANEGNYQIYAESTGYIRSEKKKINVIQRDLMPPDITILHPRDGDTFTINRIIVNGTASDESGIKYVQVNGEIANGTLQW
ncbi:MAG: DUF4430 domain-containing protein, partial [Methanosarcinales archaeon]